MPRSPFGSVVLRLGVCAFLTLLGCSSEEPPFPPEDALETFELPDGYRIELVAAEPEIRDPVAVAFDADGRLFVVEMPTYPISEDSTGTVKLLEDLDDDGRYETSHVFADNLQFAHGVLPWKNGILVTHAPDILYLADTNGDNKADVRKRVLGGFAQVNPQLRVNTPLYGLDNWIYVAYPKFGPGNRFPKYSNLGKPIHFPGHPDAPTTDPFSKGMDLRFKPDARKVEAVSGNSEYGLALNTRNHRFTSWNDQHARHVVIENKYLERNPYLAVGSSMEFIPDHGSPASVHPITAQPHLTEIRRASKANRIGTFTSACGQTVYTGGRFSPPYEEAYFVCEPVNNLVHSDRLTPRGATYDARRHIPDKEFLASTDLWFKPVSTTTGPDGALYIVDFYRKVVEHPEFIRKDYINAHELFAQGKDKGRIYRVVHEEKGRAKRRPTLSSASSEELVKEFANPNHWWRITAQRLLVEHQDESALAALERLIEQDSSAIGRMHALWTLEGLDALDVHHILRGLKDESAHVREQAIRLAETKLPNEDLSAALRQMVDDPDDRVQFQLACTLGELSFDESFVSLQKLAFAHLDEPWFRTTVLSSAAETAAQWFQVVREKDVSSEEYAGREAFVREITAIIGARQHPNDIQTVLDAVNQAPEHGLSWLQEPALKGINEGIARGLKSQIVLSRSGQRNLLSILELSDPNLQSLAISIAEHVEFENSPQLKRILAAAQETAVNGESVEARVLSINVLGLHPNESTVSTLSQLLVPQQLESIQVAAAEELARIDYPGIAGILLEKWKSYSASVREVVEHEFLGDSLHAMALLNAIEEGLVSPEWIGRTGRQQLRNSEMATVRDKAQTLLPEKKTQDLEDLIVEFTPAVSESGDVDSGEVVYEQRCSECHRVGSRGFRVGPDLATVSSRSKAYLLQEIIDPNSSIAPGYESQVVHTTSGETFSGVIIEETPTSLTIHSPGKNSNTILRTNIEAIRPTNVSLMPVGLVEDMTIQEMADLLEYIRSIG